MVSGPGVRICGPCIVHCREILVADSPEPAAGTIPGRIRGRRDPESAIWPLTWENRFRAGRLAGRVITAAARHDPV
jgi:hypothetical protein